MYIRIPAFYIPWDTVSITTNRHNNTPHKARENVAACSSSPSLLYIYNAINVWQHFFFWNVSLCLVDMEFHCILNDTRHSESLIKCYRKAILSKVTRFALHQVVVMSILKPKQRQVTLIPIRGVSIVKATFISLRGENYKEKKTLKLKYLFNWKIYS